MVQLVVHFDGRGFPLQRRTCYLNFIALGKGKRIIDVDAKISNGVLNVGMAQQNLDGSRVARRFVNERCLRAANRVRAVFFYVETDRTDPLIN